MRKRLPELLFCLASALALWAVFGAATASLYTIDTPYDYPVKPGTPEWLQYANVLGRRCEEIALLTEEEQTLEDNMAMQMYGIILEKAAGPEAE